MAVNTKITSLELIEYVKAKLMAEGFVYTDLKARKGFKLIRGFTGLQFYWPYLYKASSWDEPEEEDRGEPEYDYPRMQPVGFPKEHDKNFNLCTGQDVVERTIAAAEEMERMGQIIRIPMMELQRYLALRGIQTEARYRLNHGTLVESETQQQLLSLNYVQIQESPEGEKHGYLTLLTGALNMYLYEMDMENKEVNHPKIVYGPRALREARYWLVDDSVNILAAIKEQAELYAPFEKSVFGPRTRTTLGSCGCYLQEMIERGVESVVCDSIQLEYTCPDSDVLSLIDYKAPEVLRTTIRFKTRHHDWQPGTNAKL